MVATGRFLSDRNALDSVHDGTACFSSLAIRKTFHARSLDSAALSSELSLSTSISDTSLTGGGSGRLASLLYLKGIHKTCKLLGA